MKNQIGFIFSLLFCLPLISISQNPESLQQNLATAQADQDTLQMTRALYKLGSWYTDHDQAELSNEYLNKGMKYAEYLNNVKAIAAITNLMAINYSDMGMNEDVNKLYLNSIEKYLSIGDSVPASNTMLNLGMEYLDQGMYKQALEMELKALDLRLATGDSTNIAAYFQRIGEVYKLLGIDTKWKAYLLEAHDLSINPNYANFVTRISILNDWGGIYKKEDKLEQAETTYLRMIQLSKDNEYSKGEAIAYSNLVPVYNQLENYQKALKYAILSNEIASKGENKLRLISSSSTLASCYLKLGMYADAENLYLENLNRFDAEKYPDEKLTIYDGLINVYEEKRDFEKAYFYSKKHNELKNNVESENLKNEIAELETRYQTEKKEQRIEFLTQENRSKEQRIQLIWLLVIAMLIILIIGIYTQILIRKQSTYKQAELKQQLLKSQMNPHFLFNVLASIQSFINLNESRKASAYLSSFSSLTRTVLEYSAEDRISLEKEIQLLSNYLTLEQMRMADSFDFHIETSDDLETSFIDIPPLMIQPFVENAIKHGVNNIDYKGEISIYIKETGTDIEVKIRDNGKGMQKNKSDLDGHRSMSLEIFKKRKRIMQLHTKRKLKYEVLNLSDHNEKSGVEVCLHLPILEHD
ncbi:MAG: histidine kinase [Bacteroidales bacterium]|nr:histidine kinase [Bacteroidales bacterium]